MRMFRRVSFRVTVTLPNRKMPEARCQLLVPEMLRRKMNELAASFEVSASPTLVVNPPCFVS